MNDLPVILCYFAQSKDEDHLAMLEQEENAIQLAWEPLVTANRVQYVARGSGLSTPEQMGRDIETYGNRIVLFHFSGHAGHDTLLLSNGAGGPEGIAGLLQSYAKSLKLVVLNGCSTQNQVNTFFGRETPVVVATSCAVKDKHAMLFGSRLHQFLAGGKTILTAYRDAVLAVKSVADLGKLLPDLVAETTTVVRGGMLDTSHPVGKIWGLFIKDTGNGSFIVEDMRWLPAPAIGVKRPKINPEKAYIFERDQAPYSDTFSQYFDPARNPTRPRIQHYLLAGARAESPLGLIRKFFYESIMQSLDRQFYYYSFSDLFDGGRVVNLSKSDITVEHILRRMLLAVTGPIPDYVNIGMKTAEDLCVEFFGQNYFKRREYVVIAFRMPPDGLTDMTTKAILDTIARLNEWSGKLPDRVSFLFFWTIEQERSWTDRFRSKPLKQTIARFDVLRVGPLPPRIWVINHDDQFLKMPRRDDIVNWVNDAYRPDTRVDIPDDLLESLFGQKNVETLENKLLDLIEEANLQPT